MPKTQSKLAAIALILLSSVSFTSVSFIAGCNKEPEVSGDTLPTEEPESADTPDQSAAEIFRSVTQGETNSRQDSDWPQLFGPDRTSVVDTVIDPIWGEDGPSEIWSFDIGTGYGSPVVSDGKLVFNHRIGDQEILQCVDAETGEPIWEHRYATTFETEYEYSNGPYGTPVIAGGNVFAVGGQGQFFCLDLATGEIVWDRPLYEEYGMEDDIFPVGSAPLLLERQLIFNLGAGDKNAGIISMDRETGETLWEATDHDPAYCTPFAAKIHNQPFTFVVTEFGLVCLNPEDGTVDWTIEHRSRSPLSYNAVSPLVDGDKVLVVTGPGPGAVCVRVLPDRSYEPVWKNRRVIDCQYNSIMLHDGLVYGFTAAGQGGAEFRCVEFETGKLRWKYHSVLRRGQGLIAGNAIVLLGERGHLASLIADPKSPQVLAFTQQPVMSEPSYCSPALANGRLYLKDETRIACFDVRPKD